MVEFTLQIQEQVYSRLQQQAQSSVKEAMELKLKVLAQETLRLQQLVLRLVQDMGFMLQIQILD